MWYYIIIAICMAGIATGNVLFLPDLGYDWFQISVWTVVCTLSAIALDGVIAAAVRRLLPKKWFAIDKKIFCSKKKESRFYEKIGIKAWKDKVLELGVFTSFRKNQISEPYNNEYISRYIVEANYGVVCHLADILLAGPLTVFCCPMNLWLTVGLPVACVNVVLSVLPVFILRYNLPKLHTLYKYNQKRSTVKQDQAS